MDDKIVYEVYCDLYHIKIPEIQTASFIEWVGIFKRLTIFRNENGKE